MTFSLNEKRMAAMTSVIAAIVLTAVKLSVGVATNSLGILSEAAHSALDLIAAGITFYAVSVADKPPDEDHPYGHGKIENVSALIETILLVVTCGWIMFEAIKRLVAHEAHVEVSIYSFAVMILAIIIDFGRSRVLSKAAKKHNSQALEADALHFSSDIWTSLVVIFGLICVSQGYSFLDPVSAMAVALLVLFVSYRLGRRTIDALVDRVPRGLYEKVTAHLQGIKGVEGIENIRLRSSGSKIFADVTVSIDRTLPFEQSYAVVNSLEEQIRKADPAIDVIIHAKPVATGGESLADKIRMIVVQKGHRAPHNLEVHRTENEYHVDFDVEFPGGKNFQDAHDLTAEIEREIRRQLPSVAGITIHIEEFQPAEEELTDTTEKERVLRESIRTTVLSDADVVDCPSVILLKAHDDYNVSIICGINKLFTLDKVHQVVTRIETELYRNFINLHRVMIHAEPR